MKGVNILDGVGHTPIHALQLLESLDVRVKLEYLNPTGSVKDRAANHILDSLVACGRVGPQTTIIESSSGNFGVALAASCSRRALPFICVIDPGISRINRSLIAALGATLDEVLELVPKEGYLPARIRRVQELERTIPDAYWINQYANPLNAAAYYETLGEEVCADVPRIDYVFVAVGSCGTITGLSQRVKQSHPAAKVIAVDIRGSVIFGGRARRRYIPGVGSSIVPALVAGASIDGVVEVAEPDVVDACHRLSRDHQMLVGGSSGAVVVAIEQFFNATRLAAERQRLRRDPVVVTLFPDRGERYTDTIFDPIWCDWLCRTHAEADAAEQRIARRRVRARTHEVFEEDCDAVR